MSHDFSTWSPYRRRIHTAAALRVLLLSICLWGADAYAIEEQTGRRCVMCHISQSPVLEAGGQTLYAPAEPEEAVGTGAMCYSCHNGSVLDSRKTIGSGHQHPIGVQPGSDVNIPKGFPLTDDNRLYCGTCHSPHVTTFEIDGRTVSNLRVTGKTADYCLECHTRREGGHFLGESGNPVPAGIILSGGMAGPANTTVSCRTCHVPHGSQEKELLVHSRDRICEDCHGSNPSKTEIGPGMDSHPVGITIGNQAGAVPRPDGKKMVTGTDSAVICLTCHSAHDPEDGKHLLAFRNPAGELCVTCHAKLVGEGAGTRNNGNHPLRGKDEETMRGCNSCHRVHNGLNGAQAEPGSSSLLSERVKDSELCVGCHKAEAAFGVDEARAMGTHPLGMMAEAAEAPADGGIGAGKTRMGCGSCHKSHDTEPGYSSLLDHRSYSCLACHKYRNTLEGTASLAGSHPVYVMPDKSPISAEFLSAGGLVGEYGEMVCRTCHGVHGALKDTPLLLEPAAEKDYCASCHPAEKLVFNSKHDLKVSAPDLPNIFGRLPAQSGTCGVCHRAHGWSRDIAGDGSLIDHICSDCHSDKGSAARISGSHGHPVDVGMGDTRAPAGLPLFTADGKENASGEITCATCHDVHRETLPRFSHTENGVQSGVEGGFLRQPYAGSNALCLRCHEEKDDVRDTAHDLSRSAVQPGGEGHARERKGPCSGCHLPHGASGAMMWALEIPKGDDIMSALCQSCHSERNVGKNKLPRQSHPVGVHMAAGMESVLPLYDSNGRAAAPGMITCATCHSVHEAEPATEGGTEAEPPAGGFLRSVPLAETVSPRDYASALCIHCHEDQREVMGSSHDLRSGTCGGCHAPHTESSALMWASAIQEGGDVVSAQCLSCHKRISHGDESKGGAYSHPIGAAPAANNAPELPLHNEQGRSDDQGSMTCATCHDVHRSGPPPSRTPSQAGGKYLRVDGPTSGLCLRCHPEKGNIRRTSHDAAKSFPDAENLLGQRPGEEGDCGPCHVPHFAADQPALWAGQDGLGEDPGMRHCLGCHRPGGSGKDRIPEHMSHPTMRVPVSEVISPNELQGRTIGNFLKEAIVGAEKERWRPPQYVEVAMKFVDRLSIRRKKQPILPLYDENGRRGNTGILSCPSCHDIHNSEAEVRRGIFSERPELDRLEGSLMRTSFVDEATLLCGDCHGPDRLSSFWDFHNKPRTDSIGVYRTGLTGSRY